ncbi:glucosaminidase domain-containing protein [uncultured Winogradskyella sp.]|uniref:glucosaminidase domain-containing protein n=1 Tax=uncultured Winogradskyella sp. TaxID=395353 RepID=UPI00262BA321|nr:glucosaminidase domain-containing protein [uncultured Winogradskyella sp.]
MIIEFRYILLVLVMLSIVSCGPKKGIVTKKDGSSKKEVIIDNRKEDSGKETEKTVVKDDGPRNAVDIYIDLYSGIAKDNMRTHKIPASITLAQGILESGSGKGRLAKKANNHFGIKCHGWKGAKIYHDDDRSQECFRKYRKAETSYEDHSEFLTGRKRYAGLFKLKPDDYKGWAKGLRAAGYATDRKYPQKLISLIERYQLYKYDEEVLGKSRETSVLEENSTLKHIVVRGDTLYSLSRFYKTTVDAIKAKNNLTSNDLTIGQQLIIPN